MENHLQRLFPAFCKFITELFYELLPLRLQTNEGHPLSPSAEHHQGHYSAVLLRVPLSQKMVNKRPQLCHCLGIGGYPTGCVGHTLDKTGVFFGVFCIRG